MSEYLLEPTADELIGERVRLIMNRNRPRVTQKQLAMFMGLAQGSVSQKLQGNFRWSVVELTSVAKYLGTSLSFLAGETDDPRPLNAKVPASFETGTDDVVAGTGFEPATSGL